MKRCCASLVLLAALAAVPSLHAQANPTAVQRGSIQAGVGYLYLNTDYNGKNQGLTAWVDYDFAKIRSVRVGADVTLHFGGIISPYDIGENTYMVGPRFTYRNRKVEIYGKGLFGRGTISNQDYNTSSSFNVFGFGGGVDYHLAAKYKIRVDFDQQLWPNFEPNTLSPQAISVGVMYVIR